MSEPLLEKILEVGGLESLTFILLNSIAHVIKKHSVKNLQENQKYGDLKKQLFLFENQYTGFDALFIDYYTNTRFKIDQELEADLFSLKIMNEMGLEFSIEKYKSTLKVLQDEQETKNELMRVDTSQFESVFRNKSGEFKSNINVEKIFLEFKAKVSQL